MSKSQSIKLADQKPELKSVKISMVRLDGGTQVRVKIDPETVQEYKTRQLEGDKLPPVKLFFDGSDYWPADGFHRILATVENNFLDIGAEVYKGSKLAALQVALGSNHDHGLPLTIFDKNNIVEMALKNFPNESSRALEKMTKLSHTFIDKIRSKTESGGNVATSKRVGADGKSYPSSKSKTSTVEQFAETVAPRLTAGAAPLAAAGPVTRGNSSAYTSDPTVVKTRKLNEFEQKAITELEVCIENSKYVIDQIRAGEYSPDEANDCRLQFQVAAKILKALPKQEAERS